MRKFDKYLLVGLVILALVGMLIVRFLFDIGPNKYLVIEIDGNEYRRIQISDEDLEERYFDIQQEGGQFNQALIIGGTARMLEANCPDKLCIHQGVIRGRGPLIVCLPNRVVLRIEGGEEE